MRKCLVVISSCRTILAWGPQTIYLFEGGVRGIIGGNRGCRGKRGKKGGKIGCKRIMCIHLHANASCASICMQTHHADSRGHSLLLPCFVVLTEHLFQRDRGRFDGFQFKQVVHRVSLHKEIADVVDGKRQVLVAAVVGGSTVFQAVAPRIGWDGCFEVRFKLLASVHSSPFISNHIIQIL